MESIYYPDWISAVANGNLSPSSFPPHSHLYLGNKIKYFFLWRKFRLLYHQIHGLLLLADSWRFGVKGCFLQFPCPGTNSLIFINCLVFGDVVRVEVRFLAKIRCLGMFEVRFLRFWKNLGPYFINKIHKLFSFWWCLWDSKFSFGPKWDV